MGVSAWSGDVYVRGGAVGGGGLEGRRGEVAGDALSAAGVAAVE